MWKNQRGFSLVETIILIALLGILVGSAVTMIGHIRYANTKKVAEEVDTALSRLRLETMSREGRQYLYIYKLTDGYYMKVLKDDQDYSKHLDGNGTRLCGDNVTFSYGDGKQVDGTDKVICVAYTKSGLFRIQNEEKGVKGTNTESITITGSGTYTIILDPLTGRHYFK